MRIYKDIEIDADDLSFDDLQAELKDRLASKFILCTDEYQKEKEPEVQEMLKKFDEVMEWYYYKH